MVPTLTLLLPEAASPEIGGKRKPPNPPMLPADFPQAVPNTLWAFATMGRKPGGHVMDLLDRRVEVLAGEFKSQEVANTLWTLATMGRSRGKG